MPEPLPTESHTGVDPSEFRHALGRFATGVCVITATGPDRAPVGVTVSAFASLSLSPPLVLFCLGRATARFDAYERAHAYGISILAATQGPISDLFASQRADKFESTAYRTGRNGCPLIEGSVATLECSRVTAHDGGDHRIFVVRVDRIVLTNDAPLVYFRGSYESLAPGA